MFKFGFKFKHLIYCFFFFLLSCNDAAREASQIRVFSIDISVTGLEEGESVQITETKSGVSRTIATNSRSSLPNFNLGDPFSIEVTVNPVNKRCSVSNSNTTGLIDGASDNVNITCLGLFSISGNITGLEGDGLVLRLNSEDDLSINKTDNFIFSTPLVDGSPYTVAVVIQPSSPDQSCTVTDGSGAVSGANVGNVVIICVNGTPPTASNVSIIDENGGNALVGDSLTGNYLYNDVNSNVEGVSIFRWLRNGAAIGGAGGTGAEARKYTVAGTDIGQTIVFEVTPVAATGTATTGSAVASTGVTVNSAPTASVSITDDNAGYAVMGDALTGNYTFEDVDSDLEGTSTYRWLRDGAAISGATKQTYTLAATDVPSQITFEVTPVALTGVITGSVVTSNGINTRKPLNDTGITGCGDFAYTDIGPRYDVTGSGTHNNNLDCSTQATVPTQTTDGVDADGDIIRAGQDAFYGRDVSNNDDSDGHAGFSFTKLDSNGAPLVTQSQDYAATPWSCVKDNVTGLIWEVKTPSGLQSSTYFYTWYNSTGVNDGGDWGIGDTGVGATTGYETIAGTYVGSDNCADPARCDTEKYVVDVNASQGGVGLCGATDWRLPNRHELNAIVNNNNLNPAIDVNYYPNSQSDYYWSSSPYLSGGASSWYVDFAGGSVFGRAREGAGYVRLVRGGQ